MDGIACAAELLPLLPGCKLVLCTANVQSTIQKRAREAGLAFVAKPLSKEKLEAVL
jgi:CheY-like chemotaxis protein